MNELALFAGAGGGILVGKILGWKTVCAVEWEPYCQAVLLARRAQGLTYSRQQEFKNFQDRMLSTLHGFPDVFGTRDWRWKNRNSP